MRVFPCMLVLALLCTTATGCSLFKKNTNGAQGPGNGGMPPAKFPGARNPDPLMPTPPPAFPQAGSSMGPNNGNSVLAGTVVDAYHRPMGNAYIRWVNLVEKDAGAPIDVAADANGHFIIQGVKPGASYKLIARTKQGEKMLAGTVLTRAPDVRVLIPIREDLVTADTPPLPASPALQKQDKDSQGTGSRSQAELGNEGKTTPAPKGPSETPVINVPAPPANTPVGNPPPSVGTPNYVPGVVETPFKDRLPMLTVPGNNPRPEPPAPPTWTPGGAKLDTGPTRVPSCVLLGNHLENLALKDSKGQAWEYKKHAAGKLVLIDFWGTQCVYCRDSMPTLNRLQTQYGSRGLEVIGIAIEAGKDERKEADAVNKMCTAMQLSYRQMMGHVGTFDAGKSFNIKGLPTMFLLDEQGDIIWHNVGRPDPARLSDLERVIQFRLNNRAF
jgi:thiol-disulfide isomerase/thioredoxin